MALVEYGQNSDQHNDNNNSIKNSISNIQRDMKQRTTVKGELETEVKDLTALLKDLHVEDRDVESGEGVFLVSAKNAFALVKRDNSVNTYSRISTVPQRSERSE